MLFPRFFASTAMGDEAAVGNGHGGPPLASDRALQWISGWAADQPDELSGPHDLTGGFSSEDDHDFRPVLRPPVPILTVLDDGCWIEGEDIRLRTDIFRIGRTAGDLRLVNDPSVSSTHAEIRRTSISGGYQWMLHDTDSLNGTFVRCARAVLHDRAVVILGSRRFRVHHPLRPWTVSPLPGRTNPLNHLETASTAWPMLEELSSTSDPLRISVRADHVSLGRMGGGADVELDDPLLAYEHASLTRQHDGSWLITAAHTRNGVWVSTLAVPLTSQCHFRLGEQVFRFAIP